MPGPKVYALFLTLAYSSYALGMDLKGFEPGKDYADSVFKYQGFDCHGGNACGMLPERVTSQWIDPLRTFGGANVTYWSIHKDGENIGRITALFSPESFDGVALALQEKYGRPSSKTETAKQNRMGAKFIDTTLTWRRDKQVLKLQRYAYDLDTAEVTLASESFIAIEAKRKREAAESRRKDL